MDVADKLNAALAGRYKVEREIGAGGMATVFLAYDARHGRQVALKVLNAELGSLLGAERFLAEIQVTANLQHPHILPLFDSGEADGLLFFVMPYVSGQTLRTRLQREKQLPVDEAIHIAAAVAGALDYAHRHGIVHRDLKPENILLHEGQPLVADFGIALAVANAGGARFTQTGISLGTPQYMSPEQASGDRTPDGRSDIYSLGAVTYETLTGDPPHAASTAQAIIAKVLTDMPRSIQLARSAVPDHVDGAITRALAKLPADRWSTAREFAEALLGQVSISSDGVRTPRSLQRGVSPLGAAGLRRSPLLVILAATAVVSLTAAVGLWLRMRTMLPQQPVHFAILPQAARLTQDLTWSVTVSPDGRIIVFTGVNATRTRQLYARSIGEPSERPIAGTQGAAQPFFSPDGRWLAFTANGKLNKVPIEGGLPIPLTSTSPVNGATWLENGDFVLGAVEQHQGLSLVSAKDGRVAPLTAPDTSRGEIQHIFPLAHPNGTHALMIIWKGSLPTSRLGLVTLANGRVSDLGVTGIFPVGVFGSRVVYVRHDGFVMAAELDMRRARVVGTPVTVYDPVPFCSFCNGDSQIAVSRSGTLVALSVGASRLAWVDMRGAVENLSDESRQFQRPRVSPDGRRVAVEMLSAQGRQIWTYDLQAKALTRFSDGDNDRDPEWSPDGKRILFVSDRETGRSAIWWQASEGSAAPQRLMEHSSSDLALILGMPSPDGRSMLFQAWNATTLWDIWSAQAGGMGATTLIAGGPRHQQTPRFSPNGRWVAYTSSDGGVQQVLVRPFPDTGVAVRVSISGGTEPVWSHDGRRLFYRVGRRLMSASVRATPSLTVLSRDVLFEGDFVAGAAAAAYDINRQGTHFVMLEPTEAPLRLAVVVGWIEELRTRTRDP